MIQGHPVSDTSMSSQRKGDAEDAGLVFAVARGDEGAYATLYSRYGPTLLGLVYRIVRNRAEAEDVLQDVFLQVWRRASTFDDVRGSVFVWLTMLARSRALDRLDLMASRDRTARAATAVDESTPDAADLATSAQERRRLLQALAVIPDAQRQVLQLAYFEGLSQREIAARLDRPLGTIKSLVRLGLNKLRRQLAPGGGPGEDR